jgi:hypothetical protein
MVAYIRIDRAEVKITAIHGEISAFFLTGV